MNRKPVVVCLLALSLAGPCLAELTAEQKVFDFQVMASLYAKRYAPYDWKKQLFGYDALSLKTWLDAAQATASDPEYLDLMVRYVASLKDTHSSYRVNSSFIADLGIRVDVYFDDTRENSFVLIDSVNRTLLPSSVYPFQTGDEIVSVDGVSAADLLTKLQDYMSSANPASRMRQAASYIPFRSQAIFPLAYQLPDNATVEIRRQSGAVETYTIPWTKSGLPLTRIGWAPMPKLDARRPRAAESDDGTPEYMRTLMRFRNEKDETPPEILNYGSLPPVWAKPPDFVQRLGKSYDYFYSGTMSSRGFKIGYLRIPNFAPANTSSALKQLDTEIAYLQDNTDGLVLDVMRNNGGDPCYGESVLSRVIPNAWRAMGRQIRPIWDDVDGFKSNLDYAQMLGLDQPTIDLLQGTFNAVLEAYNSDRGLTQPLATCAPGLDRTPAKVAYSKPILLLTDEFSTSAADGFSAQFQDNKRGKLYGWRTNGAGGGVLDQPLGFYSEIGTARVTVSMHYRPDVICVKDYPDTHYVENVGVQPDIWADYMRVSNQRQNGKPFVDGFLDAIATEIENSSR